MIKNTVTEVKNAFDGLISRPDMAEERVSELEDMSIKSSKSKENRDWKNTEQNIQTIQWNNYKRCSICIKRRPEGEEREKGTHEIFDWVTTVTESFSKLMSDTKPQIQEAQRTPSRINTKKSTPRHIIFKLQKIKDKGKKTWKEP